MQLRIGEVRTAEVRGVARIGDDDGVARIERGQREMSESFFRPDEGQHLALGIQLDPVTPAHEIDDRAAIVGQTPLERVLLQLRPTRRLPERLDRDVRHRQAGIPRPEIEHVPPRRGESGLRLRNPGQRIRRQGLEPARNTGSAHQVFSFFFFAAGNSTLFKMSR